MSYRRALVKLTGEAFCQAGSCGLDPSAIDATARELAEAARSCQIAVVVGGGNFLRGATLEATGLDRARRDQMGMVATVLNAMALEGALKAVGVPAEVMNAFELDGVVARFDRQMGMAHMESGAVLICSGGTGNPFFTTDTAAALRAAELGAEVVAKATKVDGVYDADPALNSDASRFDHLTYLETLRLRLQALDSTALSMCMENDLPIVVFNMFVPGNLERVLAGEQIGTLISESKVAPNRSG